MKMNLGVFLEPNNFIFIEVNTEYTKGNIADTEIHKNIIITRILIAINAVLTT